MSNNKWRCVFQVGKRAPRGGWASGDEPGWAEEQDLSPRGINEGDRERHVVMGVYLRVHKDYADLELRYREKPSYFADADEKKRCQRRKMCVGLGMSDIGLEDLAWALLKAAKRVRTR